MRMPVPVISASDGFGRIDVERRADRDDAGENADHENGRESGDGVERHQQYVLREQRRRKSRCDLADDEADDAQGEGLGSAAWSVMRQETPKMFWRSRHDNPINDFYMQVSDGCMKCGHWTVFWYGLDGFAEIERAVGYCLNRPATFHEKDAE